MYFKVWTIHVVTIRLKTDAVSGIKRWIFISSVKFLSSKLIACQLFSDFPFAGMGKDGGKSRMQNHRSKFIQGSIVNCLYSRLSVSRSTSECLFRSCDGIYFLKINESAY